MEGSSTDVDAVEAESEEAESEKMVGENAAVLSVVVFDFGVNGELGMAMGRLGGVLGSSGGEEGSGDTSEV